MSNGKGATSGEGLKGKRRQYWHFGECAQPVCEFWPRVFDRPEYLEILETFKERPEWQFPTDAAVAEF